MVGFLGVLRFSKWLAITALWKLECGPQCGRVRAQRIVIISPIVAGSLYKSHLATTFFSFTFSSQLSPYKD